MWEPSADHPIRRLFAGYTEQTFAATFGIADPQLIDYLSTLLARFIHTDAIFRLKDASGKSLEEIVAMMLAAEGLPTEGRTAREVHRHIGDFALFWVGVFPDAIGRQRTMLSRDPFGEYCRQGKRSYKIASQYDADPYREEAAVLKRLSDEFELCAYGLQQVRKEWETHLPETTVLGHKLIG